jgi:hypothetical protein
MEGGQLAVVGAEHPLLRAASRSELGRKRRHIGTACVTSPMGTRQNIVTIAGVAL